MLENDIEYLMNQKFIQKYTSFDSFEELINRYKLDDDTFDITWNLFISEHSSFSTWDEMINKALSYSTGDL